MAANFYFVFVKNKEEIDIQQFLSNIDFEGFIPIKEVDIWHTFKPDTLYVGRHEEYLIFAEESIPFEFYKEKPGLVEKKFIEFFPNSEIAAFVLNESVGMFGYAIIENGERKRINLGSDGETHLEIGEKLPIELNILEEEIFSEDELEEMRENGEDIDSMIDFEASYRVTGRLISERLGKDFYTLKDNEVKLFRYE